MEGGIFVCMESKVALESIKSGSRA